MGFLQFRQANADEMYSPNGDIAHNFIDLVRHCAYGLEPTAIGGLFKIAMEKFGCTYDDFSLAIKGLLYYVKEANNPEVATPHTAMEKSGFFDANQWAQLILMAKLGQVVTCVYFTRTREANDPKMIRKPAEILARDAEIASKALMERLAQCNTSSESIQGSKAESPLSPPIPVS